MGWALPEQGRDLGGELGRDSLIGVEGEHPVVRGQPGRVVLLVAVARPVSMAHAVGMTARQRDRLVGAPAIDDDDLVGPRNRRKRVVDVRRLVQRDDDDRQLRHARECSIDAHRTGRTRVAGISEM